eukprot:6483070-Amphidinium_carterae.2
MLAHIPVAHLGDWPRLGKFVSGKTIIDLVQPSHLPLVELDFHWLDIQKRPVCTGSLAIEVWQQTMTGAYS